MDRKPLHAFSFFPFFFLLFISDWSRREKRHRARFWLSVLVFLVPAEGTCAPDAGSRSNPRLIQTPPWVSQITYTLSNSPGKNGLIHISLSLSFSYLFFFFPFAFHKYIIASTSLMDSKWNSVGCCGSCGGGVAHFFQTQDFLLWVQSKASSMYFRRGGGGKAQQRGDVSLWLCWNIAACSTCCCFFSPTPHFITGPMNDWMVMVHLCGVLCVCVDTAASGAKSQLLD